MKNSAKMFVIFYLKFYEYRRKYQYEEDLKKLKSERAKYDDVVNDEKYELETLTNHEVEEMARLILTIKTSIQVKLDHIQKSMKQFSLNFTKLIKTLVQNFSKSKKFKEKLSEIEAFQSKMLKTSKNMNIKLCFTKKLLYVYHWKALKNLYKECLSKTWPFLYHFLVMRAQSLAF